MADTDSHATHPTHASGADAPEAPPSSHSPPPVPVAGEVPPALEASEEQRPSAAPGEAEQAVEAEAAEIESELGEFVKTVAQRDEYLALAQRTQADFENYRKRVARDAMQAQERGVAKLAKELLPALDNLGRAIEAALVWTDGPRLMAVPENLLARALDDLARIG